MDQQVAKLKLASLGVRIDELTTAQNAYAGDWRSGT
ncbi:MAG: hypothetical protein M3506_03745 [Chloroflexota bacterium]|nr:hypothetical protein [Chloroflexota bacterium]